MTTDSAPGSLIQTACLGYYGLRARVVVAGVCGACGKTAMLDAFDAREWVRLGPLPIFPLRAWRVFERCPWCGHERRVELAEYRAWAEQEAEPELAAYQADPASLEARLALVWKLYGLGLTHRAMAFLAPLLVADAPPAARHAAGVLLRSAGRHDEALAHLRAAAEADPHRGLYRLELGRQLLRRRRTLALAEHHLSAAVEHLPADFDAWAALARARTWQGHWPEAWQAWQHALDLDPAGLRQPPHRLWIELARRKGSGQ